jgi:hypothetical protein
MPCQKSWSGIVQGVGQHQRYSKRQLLFHGSKHVLHTGLDAVGPNDLVGNLP